MNKDHWNQVYQTKSPEQVSWTQQRPSTSLEFIHSFAIDKNANIIDVGGGDSRLVDHLLDEGFENITVLDISEKALEKAKLRLGKRAGMVRWIVGDVLEFHDNMHFDVWHDRAAFHFLTKPSEISQYISIAASHTTGFMAIGTFSLKGPDRCSGLPVKNYNENLLEEVMKEKFKKLHCKQEDHITPFQTVQNFLFCSFQVKKEMN